MKNNKTDTTSMTACRNASCASCDRCALVNFEEARPEFKVQSSQLYGKEAEHYFFYFVNTERKAV